MEQSSTDFRSLHCFRPSLNNIDFNSMSIAHYVSFVFCSTLHSHFVYWIVLSAALASLELHNIIIICTVVVVVEYIYIYIHVHVHICKTESLDDYVKQLEDSGALEANGFPSQIASTSTNPIKQPTLHDGESS